MSRIDKETERRLAKLDALEAGGVDNWDWYEESLKEWDAQNGKEEAAEKVFNELMEILSQGAYEPSESGAGFAFDDKQMDIALEYLLENVEKFKGE